LATPTFVPGLLSPHLVDPGLNLANALRESPREDSGIGLESILGDASGPDDGVSFLDHELRPVAFLQRAPSSFDCLSNTA